MTKFSVVISLGDALDFFAEHGMVSCDPNQHRDTRPYREQLQEAVEYAVQSKRQSREMANAALARVLEYFDEIGVSFR